MNNDTAGEPGRLLCLPLPCGYTFTVGIWNRLETVIKSYLADDDEKVSWRSSPRRASDPDLDAAYEELDDFLGGKNSREEPEKQEAPGGRPRPIPEELRKDFGELGLTPEASAEECKIAYKKLLKQYHPDRHANNPEYTKKATEKTARVNTAYKRLLNWFESLK